MYKKLKVQDIQRTLQFALQGYKFQLDDEFTTCVWKNNREKRKANGRDALTRLSYFY